MGVLEQVASMFPAEYYRYALLSIFGFAGLSKLIPAQKRLMMKNFPFLPIWTWNTVAVWEIGLVFFYFLLGFKVFALNMAYMVLGGIIGATCFQSKTKYPVSLMRKTYGFALIPPLGTCLLTACVAFHDKISTQGAPLAVFIGIVCASVLTGK